MPFYQSSANSYLRYVLFLVLCTSWGFVFFFNRIRSYTSTWGSPSSIRRSSHWDLLEFSAAIRRRFEKKQTVKGGSMFAMYRLGIMAAGAFGALFQPLEGSFFVSPRAEERYTSPSYPIPSLGSSSSSTWRRICELNSNGSPPFRSFQRVPMFSLDVQSKSSSLLCPFVPSVSASSCLDAVTQVGRSHFDFVFPSTPRRRFGIILFALYSSLSFSFSLSLFLIYFLLLV